MEMLMHVGINLKNLTAVALGMKTATVYDGIDEANRGYIIETKQVDVLA